jgi:predicted ATPase
VPITRLRLRNFKSFADSGEIPLAPLTVVFGRNNTGKSSILQSLLLLRQTLDAPGYGARLNLAGPAYAAGSFSDLVHKHLVKQHILIELSVATEDGRDVGDIEMEFVSDEPNSPRLARLSIAGGSADTLEIRRGVGAGGPYEMLIGGKSLGKEKKADFRFSVTDFLPYIGVGAPKVGRPNAAQERARNASRRALGLLREALRSIRAVGAFRSEPARRYELQGRLPGSFASSGEDVVNALIEDQTRRRRRGELTKDVNRWLKAVGGVRLLPPRSISKAARIYELRLKDETKSRQWANFADVGFGIGQALPVFVEGLRTAEGGLFLAQEPEIHLHPDAQLGMADFLVALVRAKRRVLVETHSENILLRIRHSILGVGEGKNGKRRLMPRDLSIIHVDKGGGNSQARQLHVDELGQILDWPATFMGEATRERMDILEKMAQVAEDGG